MVKTPKSLHDLWLKHYGHNVSRTINWIISPMGLSNHVGQNITKLQHNMNGFLLRFPSLSKGQGYSWHLIFRPFIMSYEMMINSVKTPSLYDVRCLEFWRLPESEKKFQNLGGFIDLWESSKYFDQIITKLRCQFLINFHTFQYILKFHRLLVVKVFFNFSVWTDNSVMTKVTEPKNKLLEYDF
jgi:hypothetical protein